MMCMYSFLSFKKNIFLFWFTNSFSNQYITFSCFLSFRSSLPNDSVKQDKKRSKESKEVAGRKKSKRTSASTRVLRSVKAWFENDFFVICLLVFLVVCLLVFFVRSLLTKSEKNVLVIMLLSYSIQKFQLI